MKSPKDNSPKIPQNSKIKEMVQIKSVDLTEKQKKTFRSYA
jgi:hypothetical protein